MEVGKPLPVFCFLDERGTIGGGNSDVFAIGAIVHPWPDNLNEKLHSVFECYIQACKRDRCAQEFHFADLTSGTVEFYIMALRCLKDDPDWRFFSVVLDLKDPLFETPKDAVETWACYLRWIKLLLQRNLRPNEKATVLADFLRKPQGAVHSLATLHAVVPQVWDVLQVESQGILLVQMSDVLLGASLYSGKNQAKLKLSEKVKTLRGLVAKPRFNEWRVRWNK